MIRTVQDQQQADQDPFGALDILRALQKETKHLSDEFISFIWICLQDEVCPEIQMILKLDSNGEFPYAKPCGGKSLDSCLNNHLPHGFLERTAFAPGRSGFYSQGFAQSCLALKQSLEILESKQSNDDKFKGNARHNADMLLAKQHEYIFTPYAGHTERNSETRLVEKLISPQLFGRFARASASVIFNNRRGDALDADGDDDEDADGDDLSYEAIVDIAAESELAVVNRIFATKRFFTAVALIAGKGYRALGRGLSDMNADFEAMVSALTGSMVERGGTNVQLLGCLPKIDQR